MPKTSTMSKAEITGNKLESGSRSNSEAWRSNSDAKPPPSRSHRGTVRALEERYYNRPRLSKGRVAAMPEVNRNKTDKRTPVIKTTVQNLNLDCVKPQRAGVIIYTVVNGSTYFGFGLDSKTHDLTDFGGGVIYKVDGNAIIGALREFEEETLGIFEPVSIEDIKQCPVIYDNHNLIIFIHMNIDPDTTCLAFHEKYRRTMNINMMDDQKRRHRDPEVCGITWLTWEEFQLSIKEKGIMFSRVQRFLTRAEDFSYLL